MIHTKVEEILKIYLFLFTITLNEVIPSTDGFKIIKPMTNHHWFFLYLRNY